MIATCFIKFWGVQPMAHGLHAAQRKIIILLKTFFLFCSSVFISVSVFNVWPKTTLFLPVWSRDAKRWVTPDWLAYNSPSHRWIDIWERNLGDLVDQWTVAMIQRGKEMLKPAVICEDVCSRCYSNLWVFNIKEIKPV